MKCMKNVIDSQQVLKSRSYKKTMNDSNRDEWLKVMKNENKSLLINKIWKLINFFKNRRVFRDKWVYKIKKKNMTKFCDTKRDKLLSFDSNLISAFEKDVFIKSISYQHATSKEVLLRWWNVETMSCFFAIQSIISLNNLKMYFSTFLCSRSFAKKTSSVFSKICLSLSLSLFFFIDDIIIIIDHTRFDVDFSRLMRKHLCKIWMREKSLKRRKISFYASSERSHWASYSTYDVLNLLYLWLFFLLS